MKIHPTSIIHDNSKIDDSVEIGPFCIIGDGVKIGKNNKHMTQKQHKMTGRRVLGY